MFALYSRETNRLSMKIHIMIVWILPLIGAILCKNNTFTNSSSSKDMYVIHAMVYQVGILTNKTDGKAGNATMGNQEALTFYHTKGSSVDLSSIPAPLLTNVTAQSTVQVAPEPVEDSEKKSQVSWSALKDLASLPQTSPGIKSENGGFKISKRSVLDDYVPDMIGEFEYFEVPKIGANKRAVISPSHLFKREVSDDKTTVKVMKGAAVIPQGAAVQSIAIPPLLSLNNNLSDIPVPIPNTSVVHYAKINTVVRKP